MGADLSPGAIRDLRRRLDLSQPAFAARLGCHPQTVAWWEQGRRHPTGLYARELRRLLAAHPPALPSGTPRD